VDKKADHVGIAENMPGTNGGFTMAAFTAEAVPAGAKLYLIPQENIDAENTRIDFPFAHMAGQEPTGFMMKHKIGPDRGFAWRNDNALFSEDWERVGLYTEEQLSNELTRARDDYQERAKKWRDSFDAMHRRAMKAEAKALTHEQLEAVSFAIGYIGNSERSKEIVAVLKTITEKE
jgi:hypothetical protein